MTVEISSRERLTGDEIAKVRALVLAAAESDGVMPVSEHVLLHLPHGGDQRARNLFACRDGELAGYAHLDTTDVVAGPSAEMVVHPAHRRSGVGTALLDALEAAADGRLRLWAHGRQDAAVALARSRGYTEERVLWQMRRSLLSQLDPVAVPDGVVLRPFVLGDDEPAWLEVNRRAFAGHPEQSGWTLDDLRAREAEPWFDPDGFLLAVRSSDDTILGFHWTKVHGAGNDGAGHGHHPIGEVYVLGVDPQAQGMGLGRTLTLAGLHHLRGKGLAQVMLYVDESNAAAVRLYERLGFRRWEADVQFRRDH